MKGYNQHSLTQRSYMVKKVPLVEESLKSALTITEGPLRVADYGSSEGLNSMIFFKSVLENFRGYSNREVFIIHTDVPENNWNALYNLINTSEDSYLSLPGVYYSTIGKSFYSQLFPSQSIHVGFSSSAFHWLSKSIHIQNKEELTLQAKQDARTIISHRVEELAVGGTLTISVGGSDPEDPHRTNYGVTILVEAFLSLIAKGLVTQQEFENTKISIRGLLESDWREILEEFQNKIQILTLETVKNQSFHYNKYLQDNDVESYKESVAKAFAVLYKTTFFQSFNKPEEEIQALFDLFIEELKVILEKDIQDRPSYTITIVIKRIDS
jgi:SAM dependent carboxyl methyltransferase